MAKAKANDPDRDEPVSLAPLDPETALEALLAVKAERPGPDEGEAGARCKRDREDRSS